MRFNRRSIVTKHILNSGGRALVAGLAAMLLIATATQSARAQGVFLPSIGPVNQSMGGVAAATPIDAAGAINWNPATLSGLKCSEVTFGLGLILPTANLSSTFGPFSGKSGSESGVCAAPTIAIAHRSQESPWTLGLGIFGIGGFSTNYSASNPLAGGTNAILFPQAFGGLGRIYSKGDIYQIIPTASLAITEKLSIGLSPTITLAQISVDPLFMASPIPFGYGPGTGSRMTWGAGFQLGAYYITDYNWQLGASVKSAQWFEPFRFHSQDPALGLPQLDKVNLMLPTIVTVGAAYTGFERLTGGIDLRYFNYEGADGFRQSGFNPDLSVAGLGWRNIFSISKGVQYQWTPRVTLRGGYTYNQNPISQGQSFFNVQTPLIIQHWLSCGGSFKLTANISANVAYTHGFRNEVTGPLFSPFPPFNGGPIPGTSVTNQVSADIVNFGMTVVF